MRSSSLARSKRSTRIRSVPKHASNHHSGDLPTEPRPPSRGARRSEMARASGPAISIEPAYLAVLCEHPIVGPTRSLPAAAGDSATEPTREVRKQVKVSREDLRGIHKIRAGAVFPAHHHDPIVCGVQVADVKQLHRSTRDEVAGQFAERGNELPPSRSCRHDSETR